MQNIQYLQVACFDRPELQRHFTFKENRQIWEAEQISLKSCRKSFFVVFIQLPYLHELGNLMGSLNLLLKWNPPPDRGRRGSGSWSGPSCWKQVKGITKGTEPNYRNKTRQLQVIPTGRGFLEIPCKEHDYLFGCFSSLPCFVLLWPWICLITVNLQRNRVYTIWNFSCVCYFLTFMGQFVVKMWWLWRVLLENIVKLVYGQAVLLGTVGLSGDSLFTRGGRCCRGCWETMKFWFLVLGNCDGHFSLFSDILYY